MYYMKFSSLFEKDLQALYAFVLLLFILATVARSTLFYGGPDEFLHFQIAYWAKDYPHLWFSMWGKPVYSLLLHPFTYLGIYGSRFFNYVLLFLGAWAVFRLNKNIWSSLVFVSLILLSPGTFLLLNSILTEMLFAVATLWIYVFYQEKKENLWPVLLSFLLFVRHEGIVVLGLLGLLYLWENKKLNASFLKKAGLALFAAPVSFSILAYFIVNDAFYWIKNYRTSTLSDYGSGSFWEYPKIFVEDYGLASLVFSLFLIAFMLIRKTAWKHHFLLIMAGMLLLFHTLLWGFGLGGAAGLQRLISPVIIWTMAFLAINLPPTHQNGSNSRAYIQFLSHIIIVGLTYIGFLYNLKNEKRIPTQAYEPQFVIQEAGEWIQNKRPSDARLYYSNPQIAFFTNLDPYSNEFLFEWYDDDKDLIKEIPIGAWFVWDGHLSLQRRLPLEVLSESGKFRLVKVFKPNDPLVMHEDIPYSIQIWERIEK